MHTDKQYPDFIHTEPARPARTTLQERADQPRARYVAARPGGQLRLLLAAAMAVAMLGLASCSSSKTTSSGLFSPYRTDLPQGNYLTREQVDQIREGMSRQQVRFVLGTPLLQHVFHTDRWDYVLLFRHANGQSELRRVTIRFANDRVASIDADPLPDRENANDPALPGFRAATGARR